MSKAKQKGTLAETAVATYLQSIWPLVERRTTAGQNDKGDIAGVPYSVVEVKNQRSYKIAEWLRETEKERQNAQTDLGLLVIKPNGVGVSKVDQWWVVVDLATIAGLLKRLEDAERLHMPGVRGHEDMRDLPTT
jgi:hypothetical protein